MANLSSVNNSLPARTGPPMLSSSDQSSHPNSHVAQAILALGVVALALAGSFVIGKTDYGIFVVLGVITVIMAGVVIASPAFGLYALIAFVYLNLSDVLKLQLGIPSVIRPLVVLMLISVLANRLIIHRKQLVFRAIELAVFAYGLVILISSFVAADKALALDQFYDWMKDFVILLMIVQLGRDENVWRRMQWVLILSVGFLSFLSCVQAFTGQFDNDFFGFAQSGIHQITSGFDSNRVSGPLADPNFYSQILLMTVPITLYRVMTEPIKWHRVLAAVVLIFTTFAIAFTYSRAAFVAEVAILLFVLHERKYNMLKVIAVGLVLLMIAIPLLPEGYIARLMTLDDALQNQDAIQTEQSFRGRYSESATAIEMFLTNPLLGVGASNYSVHYQDYSARLGIDPRAEARKAHNTYLQILAEKGALGLGVFLLMFAVLFVSLRRAKYQLTQIDRHDMIPWLSAVQYSVLAYMFTSIFLHDDYMRYFWLAIAFAASATAMVENMTEKYKEELRTGHDQYL
jgi:putative inorganic carbon (hco3(-)) transporter